MEMNYTDDTKPKKLVGTFDPDNVKPKASDDKGPKKKTKIRVSKTYSEGLRDISGEPAVEKKGGEKTLIENDSRLPELHKQIMLMPGWKSKVKAVAHGRTHTGSKVNANTDLANKGYELIKAACDYIRNYDKSKLSPGMLLFKEAMDKQTTNYVHKEKPDFEISSPTNSQITKWIAIKSDKSEHEGKVARAAARIEDETDKFGEKVPGGRKMVVAYNVSGDRKTGYSPNTNQDPIFKVPLEEGKTLQDYYDTIKGRINANVGEMAATYKTEYNKKIKAGSKWRGEALLGQNFDDIIAEKVEKRSSLVKDIENNGFVVDDETGIICKPEDLPEGHEARKITVSDEERTELRKAGINAQAAKINEAAGLDEGIVVDDETGEEYKASEAPEGIKVRPYNKLTDDQKTRVSRKVYVGQSGRIGKGGTEKFSVDENGKRRNPDKDPAEKYAKWKAGKAKVAENVAESLRIPEYDVKREKEIEKNSTPMPEWAERMALFRRR